MSFVWRRAGRLAVVLVVVSFLCYLLLNLLPGDPTTAILGIGATGEAREELRADLNLNDPLPVRYAAWVGAALTGDLGQSYHTGIPVAESLADRLPVTLELLLFAQLIALTLGVLIAVTAVRRVGGPVDRALTTGTFGLLSIPVFVTGVVLIFVFAVVADVLPATGFTPLTEDPAGNLRSLVLPALTIALPELAVYSRLLRTDLIATLQEDYIALARARGLSSRRIMWRHALRPSLISLVTVVGLNLGTLIGGAVIVETLFGLPGVGRLIVESIFARDYLVVQGGVVLISVGYVVINFAVDLLYAVIDPRIRRAAA